MDDFEQSSESKKQTPMRAGWVTQKKEKLKKKIKRFCKGKMLVKGGKKKSQNKGASSKRLKGSKAPKRGSASRRNRGCFEEEVCGTADKAVQVQIFVKCTCKVKTQKPKLRFKPSQKSVSTATFLINTCPSGTKPSSSNAKSHSVYRRKKSRYLDKQSGTNSGCLIFIAGMPLTQRYHQAMRGEGPHYVGSAQAQAQIISLSSLRPTF
ncbi:unnamed protein product [Danaus chrysippus]|uniref:(African queen) hypothetical protein n=1 Tax=Danaus chrysippus TaxID=151541 RepID=A0A8J2Q5D2_9NEOP|nr:unnamed protein product [Danaus chrysippus]